MKTRVLALAVLLAACASAARAAVVTLKDGSVLQGRVAGQTADGLELVTPDGTLHIGLDRVARVDYSETAPAAPPLPGGVIVPSAPRKQMLSLGLGLVEPVGHVDFHSIGGGAADDGDLGVAFGAQYLYFLTPRLGVGFDTDYADRSGTISPRLLPNATASVGGNTWTTLAVARYTLVDRGFMRPFVLVGAGGAWNSTTVDARPAVWQDTGTHETRRLVDDSQWTPAATARVGLDFDVDMVAPGILTLEAGWTGLASARYAPTPAGQELGLGNVSGPLSLVTFSARYGWRF